MFDYTVVDIDGKKFAVPPKGCFCHKTVMEGKQWEPETAQFVKENHKGLSIIHAGTYFGDMLPEFSKAVEKRIWTFEPNPESAFCARKTIELNNLTNVMFFEAGLGDMDEHGKTKNMKIDMGGMSQLGYGNVPVKMVAIDSVVSDNVSIIHLDVEGYEENAVMGAWNIIHRDKPILILEYYERLRPAFKQLLQSWGYEVSGIVSKHNTILK